MTGQGLSYRKRIRQRVHFPEYGVDRASRSLASYLQWKHGVRRGKANPPTPWGGGGVREEEKVEVDTGYQHSIGCTF